MDANGTRYHLIYGPDDWGACLPEPEGSLTLGDLWKEPNPPSPLPGLDPESQPPEWDPARAELTLPARIFLFNRAPQDKPPRLADRRGAASDAFGNLYWISPDEHSLLVRSAGSGKVSLFWETAASDLPAAPQAAPGSFQPRAPEAPRPLRLRGLAVTCEHYLVTGVLDPPGLLIFDLHGGGAPTQVRWPAAPAGVEPFAPFDMAARPDGGVWVLDRRLDAPPLARLWSLDRRLNVLDLAPAAAEPAATPPIFQPAAPASPLEGRVCPPQAVLSYDAAILLRSGDPAQVGGLVAVEALPDQSAILLDIAVPAGSWAFSNIVRYSPAGLPGPGLSTDVLQARIDPGLKSFSLLGHDFVFLPLPASGLTASPGSGEMEDQAEPGGWGMLYVVQQDGNQAYAFSVFASGSPPGDDLTPLLLHAEPLYLPMRLFAGRGLVAGRARAYYDSGRDPVNWVPLVEQKRPRYAAQADLFTPLRPSAALTTDLRPALDSGRPDCIWHRLMIDGCLPSGTRLYVWSRSANTESDLALSPWLPEPQPYRRGDGSELPFRKEPAGPSNSTAANLASAASPATFSTWELLFQKACGRYLQIWVRLTSDGRSTPRLRALRAYYPRFSYLERYLPAVYRQEPEPSSFLDRYLANLEGLYTSLEDRIASVEGLFDERIIPVEYLDWLAGWFGTIFDSTWDAPRKRLFLAHAAELYSQRGTPAGLVRMVRLATDDCPSERIFSESLEATRAGRPSPIRIIETFRTKAVPAVIFGDPTQPESPALSLAQPDQPWTPDQGAPALHARFQAYLQARYPDLAALNAAWGAGFSAFTDITVSPLQPAQPAQAADWQRFLKDSLPFPYAAPTPGAGSGDLALFHSFLARRYGYIEAFQDAYQDTTFDAYTRFEDVPFPASLPEGGPPLYDWLEFVSIVLPTQRSAHHFTVLIPTRTGAQTEASSQLAERVERIVAIEKPAHTTFTVKEYWALFRVGEARLGFDTQLDLGSRLAPVILDASYLSQGYLTFAHPWSATNRVVLGRDALGPSPKPRQQPKED